MGKRWTPRRTLPSVIVVGTSVESRPLVAALAARGVSVTPITTAPADQSAGHPHRSPFGRSVALAPAVSGSSAAVVCAVGPAWRLGVAAQARAAALDDAPARWLVWPSQTKEPLCEGPAAWAHEADALDQLAGASASWIATPGAATRGWFPEAAGTDAASWARWVHGLPHPARDVRERAMRDAGRILLGVVLVHHDRPGLASRALASLQAQTRPANAVVVVDANSADPSAVADLERRLIDFRGTPTRLIRTPDSRLGTARGAGVAALKTDWVLFLDDDNQLPPEALATFARAAATETAEIWTCWAALTHGGGPPPADDLEPVYRPLGPVPGLAGHTNGLGDAGMMIRRSAFERLGGFAPDQTVGAEDWDLLVRAMLTGVPQAVIPRVLLWKRHTPSGMGATLDLDRARARVRSHLRVRRIPI